MAEEEIHPDLAKIFAAGDAVLPDHVLDELKGGPADPSGPEQADQEIDAPRKNGDNVQTKSQTFWHLGNLLTELYRHAIEKSNAVEEQPVAPPREDAAAALGGEAPASANGSVTVTAPKQLVTVALGDSISWGDGTVYDPALAVDPQDMSLMMLGPHDFPAMRPGKLSFKLGNKLVRPGTIDAEFVVDRHRPFCDALLEMSTELTDFWGASPALEGHNRDHRPDGGFPMYVRDLRYIFESADAASLYLKRSWRYLTENWVPDVPPPTADIGMPPTEALYTRCYKEKLSVGDGIGTEAVCFKTPNDGRPNTIRGKEGVAVGSSIIVVFRVGSVVAKTYIASRDQRIVEEAVRRGLKSVVQRIEKWCAAKSTPAVLKALPPDIRSFRDDFMAEWRDCVEHIIKWPKSRKSTEYGEAPCQVCKKERSHKRCSGCRGFTYCGTECQKKHWVHGHKKDCTGEFIALTLDYTKRKKVPAQK